MMWQEQYLHWQINIGLNSYHDKTVIRNYLNQNCGHAMCDLPLHWSFQNVKTNTEECYKCWIMTNEHRSMSSTNSCNIHNKLKVDFNYRVAYVWKPIQIAWRSAVSKEMWKKLQLIEMMENRNLIVCQYYQIWRCPSLERLPSIKTSSQQYHQWWWSLFPSSRCSRPRWGWTCHHCYWVAVHTSTLCTLQSSWSALCEFRRLEFHILFGEPRLVLLSRRLCPL